ncbi:MAG: sigma-70 family RNA polymerase sigma factor [Myxococcales bacterium]|nr:sigma-70 family RNA polymerase sigma factor [Myxococcales bacterium]MCB9581982.1 sigma-70 family RNA polymerase sigma factor [Polyangiaceae bacterium]
MDILTEVSALARRERSALAALARGEGATAEDAVDAVQEALCTLLTQAGDGKLPADPAEWGAVLAVMVRNVARNRRRRHDRARPHLPVEDDDLVDELPTTDVLIARAEDHVRLRACVEDLCEIQQAVVTLRMLEERPGEDVARALGITPGHVAVLLHRAKAALRVCMMA